MGLKKPKTLQPKLTVSYFRIRSLGNDFDRMDSTIIVAGYIDEESSYADYENRATDKRRTAPLFTFHHELGAAFSERIFNGQDKVKNIKLAQAYQELIAQAQAEAEKPIERRNVELAFFADAQPA